MTQPATSDSDVLNRFVDTWKRACRDFVALARAVPEEHWDSPTDLEGWSVKDNVAHTAHLEAVLAGAQEETIEVQPAPHIKGLAGFYTEQGILARRGRTMAELVDEIETSVATRLAALEADPPTDSAARPAKTPGDVGWDIGRLLSNRPFDVWMHEQDIRRAIGQPGGYDSPAAAHTIAVLGRGLPMVLGKRVSPPAGTSVRVDVPEAERSWTIAIGDDGRAQRVDDLDEPTARVTLSAEDFVVLAGGRRGVGQTEPSYSGDVALGRRLLDTMAITP